MTSGSSGEKYIAWREYNIHGDDDEEDVTSNFNLFAQKQDDAYETLVYRFPQHSCTTTITLRGQQDYDSSTGMSVWKGSEIMCDYICQHADLVIRGKRVLELGAGVGLCGILASKIGSCSVRLTDGDANVLDNLRHNMALNSDSNNKTASTCSSSQDEPTSSSAAPTTEVSCPQLIWGKQNAVDFKNEHGKQDVILATDCVYITKSVKPLFETIHQILSKEGLFLYVNTCASQCDIDFVLKSASEFGFVSTNTWSRSDDEDDPVYIFRRKAS